MVLNSPLHQNLYLLIFPIISLEQSLRAIWSAPSWAAVLIFPQKNSTHNSQVGHFFSQQYTHTHTHTHTHITQLHSSISEHLVCFQVLDIVNKTTMNMGYRCLFKLGFLLFLNIFQEAKARFSDPNFSDLSVLKLFLKAYISLGFGLSGHTQTTCCQCSLAKDY